MKQSKSKWIEISEGIKNIAEIVAISIAGIWALMTFFVKDSPNLFQTEKGSIEILVDSLDSKHIHVEFLAQLKNQGKQSFELDSTEVRYWLLPIDSIKAQPYFSFASFTESKPETKKITDTSIAERYPIDQELNAAYNFFLDRDDTKMLIMEVKFYIKMDRLFKKEPVIRTYYDYRFHCIPDKK